jgi:O-antigen/teichoic acid export membrane protein
MGESFETGPLQPSPGSGADVPAQMTHSSGEPSRSSRIGRNTFVNVAGAVFSILISLATVPAYLHRIGEDRYGVLAVVWVVLGYFAVFDLGLSRATANQIARMRQQPAKDREHVFWTAFTVNATIGTLGGVALLFLGDFLLGHVLKISPALRSEAIAALPWLAGAVPLTTITLVLAGALEGREHFVTVNLLTITGLAMFQLAPLAYAYWVGPDLAGLIMTATLALAGSTVLSFAVTAAFLPLRGNPRVDVKRLRELLRYGGWITVTGLVGPILTVVDRIAIGAQLGATAVTRYAVPFTLVSRTQILSSGLARTLFPRFSMLERRDAAAVARQSLRALVAVMTPITVVGAVALEPFLRVWVGDDLATHAAPVGEILLLGMWVNSLAVVPFGFLQAQGRPDLPAKFHVLEVVPYIGALVLGLHVAGIRGAAWAWTARAAADALLLFWATRKMSPDEPANWYDLSSSGVLVVAACVGSLILFDQTVLRATVGGLLIVVATARGFRIAQPSLRRLAIRRGADDF